MHRLGDRVRPLELSRDRLFIAVGLLLFHRISCKALPLLQGISPAKLCCGFALNFQNATKKGKHYACPQNL